MSPQRIIPILNIEELTEVEMGKELIPNLYVGKKNVASRTIGENTSPIQ